MDVVIGIDAGGTHTRAGVAKLEGTWLGTGEATGGNPTSNGTRNAMRGVYGAVTAAIAEATERSRRAGSMEAVRVRDVTVAMAGEHPDAEIRDTLSRAGIDADVSVVSDILALFCAGSDARDGYVIASGTGAAAISVRGREVARMVDGLGWIAGDRGSGFWMGREVIRAVAADLDGSGPRTMLSDAVLDALGIDVGPRTPGTGRSSALDGLIQSVYGSAPISISRFAPLTLDVGRDHVADAIRSGAATALAGSLDALLDDTPGPLILGGSVIVRNLMTTADTRDLLLAPWRAHWPAAPVVTVGSGLRGAVSLALAAAGSTATLDRDPAHDVS